MTHGNGRHGRETRVAPSGSLPTGGDVLRAARQAIVPTRTRGDRRFPLRTPTDHIQLTVPVGDS